MTGNVLDDVAGDERRLEILNAGGSSEGCEMMEGRTGSRTIE